MKPLRIAALSALAMGCYNTSVTMLNPAAPEYPPVEADRVRIFTSFQEVDGGGFQYDRVAIVHGEGETSDDTTSDHGLIDAIKKRAGETGCNAIVFSLEAEGVRGGAQARQGDAICIIVHNPNWDW